MPIYEFICRDCQQTFEKLTPVSRRDNAECARCGSQKTARKISLSAPAQVKSGGMGSTSSEGCGMPSCCGGGCGLPN